MMGGAPRGPQMEKLSAQNDLRQAIAGFLEWIAGEGIALMRFGKLKRSEPCLNYRCANGRILSLTGQPTGLDCEQCGGHGRVEVEREGWYSDNRSMDRLIFEYLEIDGDELERERRALLDWIQGQQGGC